MPGWEVESFPGHADFKVARELPGLRLAPGEERGIGWLRFEQAADIHVEIIR